MEGMEGTALELNKWKEGTFRMIVDLNHENRIYVH